MIIFSSIRFLLKKNNQTEIIFLKKIETEPKPVQTDRFRFRFVFLEKNRFKSVWLGFPVLARFFSVWVWFGFFGFKLIKPNQTSRFF